MYKYPIQQLFIQLKAVRIKLGNYPGNYTSCEMFQTTPYRHPIPPTLKKCPNALQRAQNYLEIHLTAPLQKPPITPAHRTNPKRKCHPKERNSKSFPAFNSHATSRTHTHTCIYVLVRQNIILELATRREPATYTGRKRK